MRGIIPWHDMLAILLTFGLNVLDGLAATERSHAPPLL